MVVIIVIKFLWYKYRDVIGNLKKAISIFMIGGLIWCPLTLVYVTSHPLSSIKYGYKIGTGLCRMKKDIAKKLPKDRYGIMAFKHLPKVVVDLF